MGKMIVFIIISCVFCSCVDTGLILLNEMDKNYDVYEAVPIPGIDTCDYGVIIRVQYTDSNVYYFRIKRSFEIFLQTLIAV